MKIVTDENILRQKSKETTPEECNNNLIFTMLEDSLKESKISGVGLSAIQINLPLRACIIRISQCDVNMINPVIEKKETMVTFKGEGCLSLPGQYITTERYHHCVVKWIDEKGEEKRGSFDGLEAVIVQHEIDHMDGIIMTDRKVQPFFRKEKKVGRNELCPCGSGKKYKKCCGVM